MPQLDSAKFLARTTMLANVVKTFNKTDLSFSLVQSGGRTVLTCTGANAHVQVNSDDLVEGKQDFEFGFDQSIITSALNKRGQVKFKIENNDFVFTTGRYSGRMVTVPVVAAPAPVAKGGTSLTLPKGLFERLQGIAKQLKIESSEPEPILIYVVSEKGVLKVSTCERYHSAAHTSVDKSLPDLRMAFPYAYFGYFNQLLALKESKDYKLRVTASTCVISSKDVTVSLPFVQAEDKDFLKVHTFLDKFSGKKPAFKGIVEAPALVKSCSNLSSIYELGCAGVLDCSAEGIKLSLKTAYGMLADTVPAANTKGKHLAHINLINFEDSLGAFTGKQTTFSLYQDPHATYMLEQQDDSGLLIHVGALSSKLKE